MAAERCPYCLADLRGPDGDEVVACAACGTEHHEGCFREHGRCTVLGCRAVDARSGRAARRALAALHPFLFVGRPPPGRRPPGFLSVEPAVVRRGRQAAALGVRLELPPLARTGERLEGRVVVDAPAPVRGLGLRLRLESLLQAPGGPVRLRLEEAALVGGPGRPWLERMRLWDRPRPLLLLARGRTTLPFALQPDRLRWGGFLPAGAALGPVQSLRLVAELDGAALVRSDVVELPLLGARAAPRELEADAPAPVEAPALVALGRAWTACPVRVAAAPWPAVAHAAVRRRRRRPGPAPACDAIDLTLAPRAATPPGGGPPALRGEVALDLRDAAFAGEVVVRLAVERRRPIDLDWRLAAGEEVVLARGDGAPSAGRHTIAFAHRLGALGRRLRGEHRRVRAQAVLLGAGLPLASRELELELPPPARRRR